MKPIICWCLFLIIQGGVVHSLLPSSSWPFVGTTTVTETSLRGGYDATIGVDPSAPLQFFTTPGNTCPYAARTYIVLKELDIPFDMMEVSGRPKPAWYLKINPRGKVPAIRLPAQGNKVVYESAICCEFLCDMMMTSSNHHLMPSDAMDRATVRLLNDHCDNVFTKTQFTFLMNKDESKDEELRQDLEEALMTYEEQVCVCSLIILFYSN